jgi:hypothetical protein
VIAATTVVWKRPSIIISLQFPAELAEIGDNYVDNYAGTAFAAKRNELDGYNEHAERSQLLYTPNAAVSALFNVHQRSVDDFDVRNQQLTVVGGNSNVNRLINAAKTHGRGAELDVEAYVSSDFKVSLGGSYNATEIRDASLSVNKFFLYQALTFTGKPLTERLHQRAARGRHPVQKQFLSDSLFCWDYSLLGCSPASVLQQITFQSILYAFTVVVTA